MEYINYDKSSDFKQYILNDLMAIIEKCYELSVPVFYFAAVSNNATHTQYEGYELNPSTFGMTLTRDVSKSFPAVELKGVEYPPKTNVNNHFNKQATLNEKLEKSLDYLQSVHYMLNIPFMLMIPFSNNDENTKYLGRQIFPKNKNINLADDKFHKLLLELTGLNKQMEY